MSPLHGLTLGDVLREHRRSRPEHTAAADGSVRLSWAELDGRVNQLANSLREQGVGGGDRIVWLDGDEYEALVASGTPDEPDVDVDPGEPVMLMYTAAFSGRPNAAMLSHRALAGQSLIMGRLAEIDASYISLNCGPLFQQFGGGAYPGAASGTDTGTRA